MLLVFKVTLTCMQSLKTGDRQFFRLPVPFLFTYSGPYPMQLVVVMAVRKAVSAATNTFTAISMNLPFFITYHFSLEGDCHSA